MATSHFENYKKKFLRNEYVKHILKYGEIYLFIYLLLLYKIEWFIDFFATNKIENLTCVIIHDNLTCVDYHETH